MWTEQELKQHLKEGVPKRVYFLWGDEPYLSARYAERIRAISVGGELSEFNCEALDGQECTAEQIEAAAETLPLMAERKCVTVRDFNAAGNAGETARILELLANPPETCVLIFWQCGVAADVKKNAKWKAFAAAADKCGAAVELPRRTAAEAARLLCAGAKKRGCTLRPAEAELLVSRCGSDLHRLLGELDKLCAIADGGDITETLIRGATGESLEARVFDLSKQLLAGNMTQAQEIVHTLQETREKPTAVLAVLSGAYVDWYRVKVAQLGGMPAEAVGRVFSYRGREFVLRNAARDVQRLPIEVLRDSLRLLGRADRTMKSSPVDKWLVLERTVVQLGRRLRSA